MESSINSVSSILTRQSLLMILVTLLHMRSKMVLSPDPEQTHNNPETPHNTNNPNQTNQPTSPNQTPTHTHTTTHNNTQQYATSPPTTTHQDTTKTRNQDAQPHTPHTTHTTTHNHPQPHTTTGCSTSDFAHFFKNSSECFHQSTVWTTSQLGLTKTSLKACDGTLWP